MRKLADPLIAHILLEVDEFFDLVSCLRSGAVPSVVLRDGTALSEWFAKKVGRECALRAALVNSDKRDKDRYVGPAAALAVCRTYLPRNVMEFRSCLKTATELGRIDVLRGMVETCALDTDTSFREMTAQSIHIQIAACVRNDDVLSMCELVHATGALLCPAGQVLDDVLCFACYMKKAACVEAVLRLYIGDRSANPRCIDNTPIVNASGSHTDTESSFQTLRVLLEHDPGIDVLAKSGAPLLNAINCAEAQSPSSAREHEKEMEQQQQRGQRQNGVTRDSAVALLAEHVERQRCGTGSPVLPAVTVIADTAIHTCAQNCDPLCLEALLKHQPFLDRVSWHQDALLFRLTLMLATKNMTKLHFMKVYYMILRLIKIPCVRISSRDWKPLENIVQHALSAAKHERQQTYKNCEGDAYAFTADFVRQFMGSEQVKRCLPCVPARLRCPLIKLVEAYFHDDDNTADWYLPALLEHEHIDDPQAIAALLHDVEFNPRRSVAHRIAQRFCHTDSASGDVGRFCIRTAVYNNDVSRVRKCMDENPDTVYPSLLTRALCSVTSASKQNNAFIIVGLLSARFSTEQRVDALERALFGEVLRSEQGNLISWFGKDAGNRDFTFQKVIRSVFGSEGMEDYVKARKNRGWATHALTCYGRRMLTPLESASRYSGTQLLSNDVHLYNVLKMMLSPQRRSGMLNNLVGRLFSGSTSKNLHEQQENDDDLNDVLVLSCLLGFVSTAEYLVKEIGLNPNMRVSLIPRPARVHDAYIFVMEGKITEETKKAYIKSFKNLLWQLTEEGNDGTVPLLHWLILVSTSRKTTGMKGALKEHTVRTLIRLGATAGEETFRIAKIRNHKFFKNFFATPKL